MKPCGINLDILLDSLTSNKFPGRGKKHFCPGFYQMEFGDNCYHLRLIKCLVYLLVDLSIDKLLSADANPL